MKKKLFYTLFRTELFFFNKSRHFIKIHTKQIFILFFFTLFFNNFATRILKWQCFSVLKVYNELFFCEIFWLWFNVWEKTIKGVKNCLIKKKLKENIYCTPKKNFLSQTRFFLISHFMIFIKIIDSLKEEKKFVFFCMKARMKVYGNN